MKRVTMIAGSLPPIACGVGYYSAKLLGILNDPDLSISVISTKGVNKIDQPMETVPDWKIHRIPLLVMVIKKTRPDIIHIQYPAVGYGHGLGINLLPYMVRLLMPKTTLIVTLHEYSASRLIGRLRDLVTILAANKIIVSNELDKRAFPRFLRRRTLIIPIGSNIPLVKQDPAYYKQIMKKGGLFSHKPTLVFFGFPHPTKRLEILLGSMNDESLKDFQLLLLTDLRPEDDYQSMLIDMITSLNKNRRRVYCTGFLPDKNVSSLLQESKYFILPQESAINGKSGTAIAAIIHGLVLVATGPTDAEDSLPYIHKENSYLIRPMDKSSLARAILEISNDSELEQKILSGAKELASYFAWDSIAKRHKDVYIDIR